MKIAILSDIHGNLPALNTVLSHIDRWRPDQVIVNGDTVNRGPQPRQTWEAIAERITNEQWLHTMGNHEEYTIAWQTPDPTMSDNNLALYKTSLWTYQLFDKRQIEMMAQLPRTVTITAADNSQLTASHASKHSTKDGMQPWTTTEEARAKISPNPPAVVITSHTHRFFTRTIDQTLVVNSGSVGCPLDGFPYTGYAQLTWSAGKWSANLVRLPYDRARTHRSFYDDGFLDEGGPTAYLLFKEWEQSRSHIYFWGRQYQPRVISGELTPKQAVDAYLYDLQHGKL